MQDSIDLGRLAQALSARLLDNLAQLSLTA